MPLSHLLRGSTSSELQFSSSFQFFEPDNINVWYIYNTFIRFRLNRNRICQLFLPIPWYAMSFEWQPHFLPEMQLHLISRRLITLNCGTNWECKLKRCGPFNDLMSFSLAFERQLNGTVNSWRRMVKDEDQRQPKYNWF